MLATMSRPCLAPSLRHHRRRRPRVTPSRALVRARQTRILARTAVAVWRPISSRVSSRRPSSLVLIPLSSLVLRRATQAGTGATVTPTSRARTPLSSLMPALDCLALVLVDLSVLQQAVPDRMATTAADRQVLADRGAPAARERGCLPARLPFRGIRSKQRAGVVRRGRRREVHPSRRRMRRSEIDARC